MVTAKVGVQLTANRDLQNNLTWLIISDFHETVF